VLKDPNKVINKVCCLYNMALGRMALSSAGLMIFSHGISYSGLHLNVWHIGPASALLTSL
jgi:hypothetical protein